MESNLKLDNQLCFKIYSAEKKMMKLYRSYLDELGITYSQYLVLLVLWEKDAISVKELGEKLILDSGTLTPMLKRMETNQLITRSRSKKDERSVVITLTPKGMDLNKKVECIPNKFLEKVSLDTDELKALSELLTKLVVN
ncbi:MAG: MarR family transcriptional regulator [Bacillota bacterium]|uniref:MarR family winged helix-turn-helix transcriptional regulator n=1 Tax=Bacillus sp. RO2 TaxID=2723913 RepID=UPI00145FC652|nr:MarR family transcriptional regulator [Bacillus sp. RO2]MEA3321133.1 MarR family transcriptional regulator [Bacillota bacterium]NMH74236.1 MarR family transcriptional regulator [Bacillus sp. RO2]